MPVFHSGNENRTTEAEPQRELSVEEHRRIQTIPRLKVVEKKNKVRDKVQVCAF